MGEMVVFCDPETLQSDYLAEFLTKRRVPQNLFYQLDGASTFYTYRNTDLAQIAWQDEFDFFRRQPFWSRDRAYAFVSLGCGNAGAEKMLLRRMHDEGYEIAYVGVDSSESMLGLATDNLENEGFAQTYVLADFARRDFSTSLWDLVGDYDTRIYAMIGGTFGNFEQTFVADLLADLVPDGDYFYLDVVPSYATEEQNERLRARLSRLPENLSSFFASLLGMLGLAMSQGRVVTVERGDGDLNTIRYTFYFEPTAAIRVSCLGSETDLEAGERIELLSIRAYDVDSLSRFLGGRGFRLVDTYIPNVGNLSHLWQRLLFVKGRSPSE